MNKISPATDSGLLSAELRELRADLKRRVDKASKEVNNASAIGVTARELERAHNHLIKALRSSAATNLKELVEGLAQVDECNFALNDILYSKKIKGGWGRLGRRGWQWTHLRGYPATIYALIILVFIALVAYVFPFWWHGSIFYLPKWVFGAGLAGGAANVLYVNAKRTLEQHYVDYHFQNTLYVTPPLALVLGAATYLALNSGVVMLSGGVTASNKFLLAFLTFFAGFRTTWALDLFDRIAEFVKPTKKE